MPTAEIITIGTELLLGEIQDTNTRFLARALRDAGVNLFRTTTVGDNASRIAQAIHEALDRSEIIITTGGLGPTVDDPTRQAVALAMGVELEFRPELWEQIIERFKRYGRAATENNKRQAYIPYGAIAIKNPVGTAPAFIAETPTQSVISLPGVPREMEYLLEYSVMPYLRQRFRLIGTIKARVLHAGGVGESQIDELIGDLEELSNPTVGLAAHAGQIDIRITARADSLDEANQLIGKVAAVVLQRLGENIFGEDEETLESVVQRELAAHNWKLVVLEAGLSNMLIQRLSKGSPNFAGGELLNEPLPVEVLQQKIHMLQDSQLAEVGLAVALHSADGQHDFDMILNIPNSSKTRTRSYGGPPQMAAAWAANQALDWLRRTLSSMNGE